VSQPWPSYTVRYDPRAAKELAKLDRPVARRIASAVEDLGDQPRPQGARPLVGYPGLWRVRIGDYRVVYAIKDAELVVLALRIAHRSDVYRNL
jgi:mRNA interferase RelE/StbE